MFTRLAMIYDADSPTCERHIKKNRTHDTFMAEMAV